jgi:RNA polymerase sigma factor (sigma-70 family)
MILFAFDPPVWGNEEPGPLGTIVPAKPGDGYPVNDRTISDQGATSDHEPWSADGDQFSEFSGTRQELETRNRSPGAVEEAPRESEAMEYEPPAQRRNRCPATPRAPLTKEQQDLAASYFPLARALARRFKKAWAYGRDEFESAAGLALVEAAQAYDPSKKVKFATYARRRIIGELRDVQRQLILRGWSGDVEEAPDVLPLVPDVEDFGCVLLTRPDGLVGEQLDSREYLESLMDRLPLKHARAFEQIYVRGLSQLQTAITLGVSQARVFRLHKQSVEMLYDSLTWRDRFLRQVLAETSSPAPGDGDDADED